MSTDPTIPPSNEEFGSHPGAESTLIGGSAPVAAAAETAGSQPPAFRRLSSYSVTELRKIRARHKEFVQSLGSHLSVHLHLEVGLKMTRTYSVPYGKWIKDFSNPTYLSLAKVEPLKETCFLEIPPQLGLSIVDRELGGAGVCAEENRELTEIESRILSRLVEMAFGEWCQAWGDLLDLRSALLGHESNGEYVQTIAHNATILVFCVQMQIGELVRQIQFGFPHATLEPLIQKLNAEVDAQPSAKPASTAPKWNRNLDDISLNVTAELPELKITTRELANMKPGDVISLEPEVLQNLRVSLAKKQKFVATAGRCESRWAAKITKAIEA